MSRPNLALGRRTSTPPPPADPGTDTAAEEPATTDTATSDTATSEPATTDPANEALAAIASTYEDARAGIISGDSSAPEPEETPRPAVVPIGHSPTVPLTLMTSLKRAEPTADLPAGARPAAATLWSRLLRRGEPARRGRHSATESDGLPAEAFAWGPPGRVRFLS